MVLKTEWNGCADGKLQSRFHIYRNCFALHQFFCYCCCWYCFCLFFASSPPINTPANALVHLLFQLFQRFRIKTHMLRCFCPQKQEINQRRWMYVQRSKFTFFTNCQRFSVCVCDECVCVCVFFKKWCAILLLSIALIISLCEIIYYTKVSILLYYVIHKHYVCLCVFYMPFHITE